MRYDQAQYPQALDAVEKVLNFNQNYPMAVMRKGRILLALDRIDEGKAYLQDAKGYFERHFTETPGHQKGRDEIDELLSTFPRSPRP